MEKSTVYFTDFRCKVGTSQLDKLKKLIEKAGIDSIDMDSKFVAIKMHFGELGNLAFLRPNYAKVVADLCKEQGGQQRCGRNAVPVVPRTEGGDGHQEAGDFNQEAPVWRGGCRSVVHFR